MERTVRISSPDGAFDPQVHYLLGLSAGRPVFVQSADVEAGAGLRETGYWRSLLPRHRRLGASFAGNEKILRRSGRLRGG